MSNLSRADVAQWYLKAGHRRLWVLPLSVVLSIFVVFLVLRRMAEDPYANLQESRAAILAYKRELPDGQNALIAISETWKLRVHWDPNTADSIVITKVGEDKEFLTQARTEDYWKASQPELIALKAALKLPDAWSQYDPDNPKTWGTYFSFSNLRDSTNLLMVDAFMHARRGNHAAAAESLTNVQQLAAHVARDPNLISLIIADAINSILHDDFWNWQLNECPPLDDAALWTYRRVLDQPDQLFQLLARTHEFERCLALYQLDKDQVANAGLFNSVPKTDIYFALLYGPGRECLNGVYGEMIEAFKHGKLPVEIQDLLKRHQRAPSLLAQVGFTRHTAWKASVRNHSSVRVLQAALAVQLFQNKYRRDPGTLDELVPEFLKEVPKDFAGNTLKIKSRPFPQKLDDSLTLNLKNPEAMDLLIYSFGLNGKDDGGANNFHYTGNNPDDFSMRLRGAATRGRCP